MLMAFNIFQAIWKAIIISILVQNLLKDIVHDNYLIYEEQNINNIFIFTANVMD